MSMKANTVNMHDIVHANARSHVHCEVPRSLFCSQTGSEIDKHTALNYVTGLQHEWQARDPIL